jgi:hypothetical protein
MEIGAGALKNDCLGGFGRVGGKNAEKRADTAVAGF